MLFIFYRGSFSSNSTSSLICWYDRAAAVSKRRGNATKKYPTNTKSSPDETDKKEAPSVTYMLLFLPPPFVRLRYYYPLRPLSKNDFLLLAWLVFLSNKEVLARCALACFIVMISLTTCSASHDMMISERRSPTHASSMHIHHA